MIICADDFGLAPDVDEAILRLAADGKISAVSVMAALLAEPTPALKALLQLRDALDVGLHLVLTDEPGRASMAGRASRHRQGRFPSFGNLLARSLTGRVCAADAKREIVAQYDRFKNLLGFAPDFLDGHRHVQQFFGVRRGLLDFVTSLPAAERPYVRSAHEPLAAILRRDVAPLKCCAISWPGAALRRLLLAQGIPTNAGFAGICEYGDGGNYPAALHRFLQHARPGNYLIMVHPGLNEDWRRAEYAALLAAQLPPGAPSRFCRTTL
jgi:hypothetical protein